MEASKNVRAIAAVQRPIGLFCAELSPLDKKQLHVSKPSRAGKAFKPRVIIRPQCWMESYANRLAHSEYDVFGRIARMVQIRHEPFNR